MRTNAIPFPVPLSDPVTEASPSPASDKLLIDMAELARLTSLSVRTLRRMDASRDIPGRVVAGRRVLFQTESIREWVRAGLPDYEHWALLQKRIGKH
jgi:predicted DNA-binding transcriptional regulator AlpA